ncbi:hypothetical protein HPB52_013081 [Rhipicephalus sanguineus]|uniref:TRAF1-6 MATH domain-containing protein n=1 Tax=Rhipicephalus sanguineus TaxID=34632 RepID=A0A9D4PCQ7_RHISA|nr:hypothetical protein HPB52_013081 [Rhipicephalus sanguineus]
MQCTQYILSGFGDFFERRCVAFVDPLPPSRVCCACGFVTSLTARLPCGHVLCRLCRGRSGGRCPFECGKFEDSDVESQIIQLSDLEQLRVSCINGGCDFVDKLSRLPSHVLKCVNDEVICNKCGGHVVRNAAVDHHRQCSVDLPTEGTTSGPASADEVAAADERPRGAEALPEHASGEEQVDQCDAANDSDCVVELGTNLQQVSSRVKRTFSGEFKEASPGTSSSTATVQRVVTPGPYRAASKPDVFVTLCRFDNIYEKYNELRYKNSASKAVKGCVAAGYTFALKCKFTKGDEDGGVKVYFSLHFGSGEWDNYVEWPFRKEVTGILTHPGDKGKDVKIPFVKMMSDTFKKPAPSPNTWNRGPFTFDHESWERIEAEGFIHNNALFVNLEFE